MAITIHLAPEDEAELRERAAAKGQPIEDWLKAVAENVLYRAGRPRPDEGGEDTGGNTLEHAVAAMQNRTPEQIAATRARILALTPPPRPLPPGKTLEDVIVGKWPGDETDEQIQAALDELS